MSQDTKICARCGEAKPVDAFGKAVERKGGRKPYCKPCHNACNKESRERNPETSKLSSEQWRIANPEKARERQRKWREANRERFTGMVMDWRKRNPEKVRAADEARKLTPEWRLKRSISSRLRLLLRDKAGRRTVDLIGYTAADLRSHLERQFQPGMTWDNYGEWHVDHIVPVASFTFTSIEDPEIKRAWSLPNLRPLWAQENMRKHDKALHLI